jgi:hypothetical protein
VEWADIDQDRYGWRALVKTDELSGHMKDVPCFKC